MASQPLDTKRRAKRLGRSSRTGHFILKPVGSRRPKTWSSKAMPQGELTER